MKRYNIDDMRIIASRKGGQCLSKTYQSVNSPLTWECQYGHQWDAKPKNVIHGGTWCKTCYNDARRIGITEMHRVATNRKGRCLSDVYIDCDNPLLWECQYGHQWFATPDKVRNSNTWCPVCASKIKKGERTCRNILEKLLQTKLPTIRPNWLINPQTGHRLELDGYSIDHKVAFEYQGPHHYNLAFSFDTPESLYKVQHKDQIKVQRCADMGIALLVIPHFSNTANIPKCINEVLGVMEQHHIVPKNTSLTADDINIDDYHDGTRDKFFDTVKNNGGRVIGTYYNAKAHVQIKCSKGHIWNSIPSKIIYGSWCHKCTDTHPLTISDCRDSARDHGGECLSHEYINSRTPMSWKCQNGHTWTTSANKIRSGHWCPVCAYIPKQQSCIINDKYYQSINEASELLKLNRSQVSYRLNSNINKWNAWQ